MAWPTAANTGTHPMMPGIQIGPPGAGALHTQLGVPLGAKLSILALAKAGPTNMKRRRAFFAKEGDAKKVALAGKV